MKTPKELIRLVKRLIYTVVEAVLVRIGHVIFIVFMMEIQLLNSEYIEKLM